MSRPRPARGNVRQRNKMDTRSRLLAAATELFAATGGQKTTIARVAEAAGVAVGTVYLHFPDKVALLEAVLGEALVALKQCLAEAASVGTARTAQQDVRQRTEGLVAFAGRYPLLATVLFDPANLGTPVGRETLDFLVASQAAGLAAGQERGWYRRDLPVDTAALVLVGGVVLALDGWLRSAARDGGQRDPAGLARGLAELRLRGIGA